MKINRILLVVLLLVLSTSIFAQQDTMYSATGDIIVGEIKSLARNVLSFDTDYADSEFKVEWDNVHGITSKSLLIIYTRGGGRFIGYLSYSKEKERVVTLTTNGVETQYTLDDIVAITTLEQNFWARINIYLDAGYSFTKANNVTQFNTSARVNYRADNWKLNGYFNSVLTNQDEVDATKRTEGGTDFSYDVWGNAFAFVGLEFLENSEQMLDLRTTSKLGMGYYFLRTNELFLQGGVGIANANESYGGDDPSTNNSFEGLAMVEFDAFDIGDFSFRTKITAFPSFSEKGRVRVDGDVSLKWDLPWDFYIKASYTHNFDSKPLIDVPNSDYVFQTSFGWEWD